MDPIILAYFGVALTLGLSGAGSIFGVTITANATVGAMKKNPDSFGNYMILSAIPSTQGLYGFLGYFMLADFLVPGITMFQATAVFFACLALGSLNLLSAIRQAQVCANGIDAIASGHDVFGKTLIVAAFAELYCIIGMMATFLIAGTLG